MQLVITNKNYSSWSLRAWLLMRQLGIPFEEIYLGINRPDWKDEVRRYASAGRVPVLIDGDVTVWETTAIAEYLAEQHEGVWPAEPAARSVARSMVAEMHAGFGALRTHMPMNIAARFEGFGMNAAVRRDVDRVIELWRGARQRYGEGGPFLFGAFSAADAFYAPVVWRFVAHGVALPDDAAAYVDAVRALPAMQAWVESALAENDFVAMDEPFRDGPDEAPRPPAPRLYRVIVPVTDLDVAVRFYAHVFERGGTRVSDGRHYFDCGGVILACLDPSRDGDPPLRPLPEHLYFSVRDLERVRARVQSSEGRLATGDVHGGSAGEIVRRPWGELSFYAVDPFDNPLCFVAEDSEFYG